ncbi:MAG: hypothetical protein JWM59_1861 [Verrucomicrobiales bacterium]|nr:hypothetical protein [Verrucomicrobiales bacterium]
MILTSKLTKPELLKGKIEADARLQRLIDLDTGAMNPIDLMNHKTALDRAEEDRSRYDGEIQAREADALKWTKELNRARKMLADAQTRLPLTPKERQYAEIHACGLFSHWIEELEQKLAAA